MELIKFPKMLYNNVLLKLIEEDIMIGKIILPDNYSDKKRYGEVINFGKDVEGVYENDTVLFYKGCGVELEINDEKYIILDGYDLKAIV